MAATSCSTVVQLVALDDEDDDPGDDPPIPIPV